MADERLCGTEELRALARIIDSAKNAEQLLKKLAMDCNSGRSISLYERREFTRHLSNTIKGIEGKAKLFNNLASSQYASFNRAANHLVSIDTCPPGFDLTKPKKLRDVLRWARSWSEHPEDAFSENEVYRYLVDQIALVDLVVLFNAISQLINSVLGGLEGGDLETIIAYSDRTRGELIDWQSRVRAIADTLDQALVDHPEKRRQIHEFLAFHPTENNVHIVRD